MAADPWLLVLLLLVADDELVDLVDDGVSASLPPMMPPAASLSLTPGVKVALVSLSIVVEDGSEAVYLADEDAKSDAEWLDDSVAAEGKTSLAVEMKVGAKAEVEGGISIAPEAAPDPVSSGEEGGDGAVEPGPDEPEPDEPVEQLANP